ncbi:MAG: 30S ribosomal subunit protein S11 [Candidatus Wolfebacteria bacterium GW2011_GWA2_42_10]|uniref:Small ribosomal subunit protein uS11 n=2 Tax=Candidatus Wolfeibacteriota TaxID=1752735 RepID=A0A0G0XL38_9BACT|nr:MAG: 30S ribosomal subunit protein S11 [Candidatus Wolfebacteria bacterium GW2011_GWB1_41_12]KKS25605.1 MAG: 30S ribosomal subunit protein S11 [Candidatus Wolfebacteria bacterium GW2011_GWA2_42_10]KKT56504.1 MAG: 30S ribosomal subunit protein S11 [Candidatus Wolfebacteria bacterium GW2011_GWA1_44_24]
MGQKKVIQKTEEDFLKEGAKLEETIAKKSTAPGIKTGGKKIDIGKIYISVTYNNTMLTATDRSGNVLAWISAGSLGFSGPKKATPFAASKMVAAISEKLKKINFQNIDIIVKGVGGGRDMAIKSLANQGFNILSIKDVTPIPHNGPKPPKSRRV